MWTYKVLLSMSCTVRVMWPAGCYTIMGVNALNTLRGFSAFVLPFPSLRSWLCSSYYRGPTHRWTLQVKFWGGGVSGPLRRWPCDNDELVLLLWSLVTQPAFSMTTMAMCIAVYPGSMSLAPAIRYWFRESTLPPPLLDTLFSNWRDIAAAAGRLRVYTL